MNTPDTMPATPSEAPAFRVKERLVALFGPAPGLKELNVLCWGCFIAFLVIPICALVVAHGTPGALIRSVEADFVYFYSFGRIANEHSPADLYNYDIQKAVCEQVRPSTQGAYGPIPYNPYVAALLTQLSRLSYTQAYLIWLALSVLSYVLGVLLLSRVVFPGDPQRRSFALCIALTFCPFFLWTAANGQISWLGFIALALAFYLSNRGSGLLAGLALSLCIYKPTLLVLVLPMLVFTRRFRMLGGFVLGSLTLSALATVAFGFGVWPHYAKVLLAFTGGAVHESGRELFKYIDFAAAAQLAGIRGPALLGIAAIAAPPALLLLRGWLRLDSRDERARMLAWAAALTWTMALNLYVPVYDAVLLVISILLTIPGLKATAGQRSSRAFWANTVLLFVGSWLTVPIARSGKVQVLTILIAMLGCVQLSLLNRMLPAKHSS